jgi:hypothetical protein
MAAVAIAMYKGRSARVVIHATAACANRMLFAETIFLKQVRRVTLAHPAQPPAQHIGDQVGADM